MSVTPAAAFGRKADDPDVLRLKRSPFRMGDGGDEDHSQRCMSVPLIVLIHIDAAGAIHIDAARAVR